MSMPSGARIFAVPRREGHVGSDVRFTRRAAGVRSGRVLLVFGSAQGVGSPCRVPRQRSVHLDENGDLAHHGHRRLQWRRWAAIQGQRCRDRPVIDGVPGPHLRLDDRTEEECGVEHQHARRGCVEEISGQVHCEQEGEATHSAHGGIILGWARGACRRSAVTFVRPLRRVCEGLGDRPRAPRCLRPGRARAQIRLWPVVVVSSSGTSAICARRDDHCAAARR